MSKFSEIFKRDWPYFLSLGMSYEDYWYGDPYLVYDYIKAEQMRQERENASAWLLGAYVYKAVDAALSYSDMFRGKGEKPRQYPSEPFPLKPKTEEERKAQEEQEAQNERLRAIAHFDALIAANQARKAAQAGQQ